VNGKRKTLVVHSIYRSIFKFINPKNPYNPVHPRPIISLCPQPSALCPQPSAILILFIPDLLNPKNPYNPVHPRPIISLCTLPSALSPQPSALSPPPSAICPSENYFRSNILRVCILPSALKE